MSQLYIAEGMGNFYVLRLDCRLFSFDLPCNVGSGFGHPLSEDAPFLRERCFLRDLEVEAIKDRFDTAWWLV